MLKHVYLVFISTFIFGCISGILGYLYVHTGEENDDIQEVSKGLVIVATMYGECEERGCPSYRIADNGAYVYLLRGSIKGDVRREDSIRNAERKILHTLTQETDLNAIVSTHFQGICPTERDGVAFQYDIEYEGKKYSFDSCVQSIDQHDLFELLKKYFVIFNINST